MPEMRIYNRKARHHAWFRRCLHLEHIKKRKGLTKKIEYIINRLHGKTRDFCYHIGDLHSYWTIPTNWHQTTSGSQHNVIVTRSDQEA